MSGTRRGMGAGAEVGGTMAGLGPPGHPLEGPRWKIERAKQHIRELDAEVKRFLVGKPYAVITNEELETGDLVYRLRIRTQTPAHWPTILGDAVHNLRSALDLLAHKLVEAGGGIPSRETGFPIAETPQKFKAALPRAVQGAEPRAVTLITALHPYQGGHHALWRLHQLDIVDKHRLLIGIGAAHRNIVFDMGRRMHQLGVDAGFVAPSSTPPSIPMSLRPADRQFPLHDNAEIFRVMKAARPSDMYVEYQFTFEIAFGEGEVVQGEPLIPTLYQLASAIEQVIALFEPLFW